MRKQPHTVGCNVSELQRGKVYADRLGLRGNRVLFDIHAGDWRRLESDPELRRRHRLRRRVGRTVLLAIFVAGAVGAVFGERGWLDVRRLRHESAALEDAIDARRMLVAQALDESLTLVTRDDKLKPYAARLMPG